MNLTGKAPPRPELHGVELVPSFSTRKAHAKPDEKPQLPQEIVDRICEEVAVSVDGYWEFASPEERAQWKQIFNPEGRYSEEEDLICCRRRLISKLRLVSFSWAFGANRIFSRDFTLFHPKAGNMDFLSRVADSPWQFSLRHLTIKASKFQMPNLGWLAGARPWFMGYRELWSLERICPKFTNLTSVTVDITPTGYFCQGDSGAHGCAKFCPSLEPQIAGLEMYLDSWSDLLETVSFPSLIELNLLTFSRMIGVINHKLKDLPAELGTLKLKRQLSSLKSFNLRCHPQHGEVETNPILSCSLVEWGPELKAISRIKIDGTYTRRTEYWSTYSWRPGLIMHLPVPTGPLVTLELKGLQLSDMELVSLLLCKLGTLSTIRISMVALEFLWPWADVFRALASSTKLTELSIEFISYTRRFVIVQTGVVVTDYQRITWSDVSARNEAEERANTNRQKLGISGAAWIWDPALVWSQTRRWVDDKPGWPH